MRDKNVSVARTRRAAAAMLRAARQPRGLLWDVSRLPLHRLAREQIEATPAIELADLVVDDVALRLRRSSAQSRHSWSLGAAEQLVLQVLVQLRGVRTAFEIGTFNGGTTRLLAEEVPEDGIVWTLDLPAPAFDATQQPGGFSGSEIGAAYRDSPAAAKIVQLWGDSLSFDFAPYEHSADLVLVDGGHAYEHGYSDTQAALRLVRPGGIIVWDDFEPYWHGLVAGIRDAMLGRDLRRLTGTSLAVYEARVD